MSLKFVTVNDNVFQFLGISSPKPLDLASAVLKFALEIPWYTVYYC